MFYIKEGRVELVLTRKGAKDLPLATRQVRAVAATDITVLEVDQKSLLTMLAEDSVAAGQLFKVGQPWVTGGWACLLTNTAPPA
eukprot:scaffold133722_cov26-Tisochrysis_lutea.AAC.6